MASSQERTDLLHRAQLNAAGGVISILTGLVAGAHMLINGLTWSSVVGIAIFFFVAAILLTTARRFFRAARNDFPLWLTPKRGDDWSRGIIHGGKNALPLFGAVAVSIAVFVAFAVKGGQYALVGGALAFVAVVRSVYLLIVWWRSGPTILLAAYLPARLGRELSGRIRTSISTIPEANVKVTLSSFSCWGVGDDGGENCLWQESQEVEPQLIHVGTSKLEIPFRFSIPSTAKPTDHTYSNRWVEWRLEASASLPVVNFDVTFHIPVIDGEMAAKIASAGRGGR